MSRPATSGSFARPNSLAPMSARLDPPALWWQAEVRAADDELPIFEGMVGASPALAGTLLRISKVAPTDSTVLITGETGSGKELVARAIHRRSRRASGAFIAVNCAALPHGLIASELFGHEKGAFTGAGQRRPGRFELADGGTLFLDEIGELSPDVQVALLRVLQERELERLGGHDRVRVDVRVIAATNRSLSAAVESGKLREDLFYRLNVFPLEVPSLRERPEDIPLLVRYFVDRCARRLGKSFRRIDERTLEILQAHPWPGNVRELQNVIERSVIVCDTNEFTVDQSWVPVRPPPARRSSLAGTLAMHEKAIIEDALRATAGRVFGPAGAAVLLGVPRSTLESRIRALKIDKGRFVNSGRGPLRRNPLDPAHGALERPEDFDLDAVAQHLGGGIDDGRATGRGDERETREKAERCEARCPVDPLLELRGSHHVHGAAHVKDE